MARMLPRLRNLSQELYSTKCLINYVFNDPATPEIYTLSLHDALPILMPSPVVELNRAVAIGMAFGPQAAIDIVNALRAERALDRYHLLPSVRGDLLEKLGRRDEARRSEEHTSELQSLAYLVCRLLLEK